MTTFDTAPKIAEDMLAAITAEFEEFSHLEGCGARIGLSFATAKEKRDGTIPPALTHHGHAALGLARIMKLEDRVHGAPDGRITIDARWWETAPEQERRALLFHELYHFDVKRGDDGVTETDDAGRPKLTMRKHDIEVGWFTATALRFGKASQECIQFRVVVEQSGQLLMPSVFGAEVAHGGDTLTITQNGEAVTIPCEDLARVHKEASHQLKEATR